MQHLAAKMPSVSFEVCDTLAMWQLKAKSTIVWIKLGDYFEISGIIPQSTTKLNVCHFTGSCFSRVRCCWYPAQGEKIACSHLFGFIFTRCLDKIIRIKEHEGWHNLYVCVNEWQVFSCIFFLSVRSTCPLSYNVKIISIPKNCCRKFVNSFLHPVATGKINIARQQI